MACTCKNITPQSKECYEQQIVVKVPDYLDIRMNAPGRERKEYVALDPCITAEVIQLWRLGIVTTGACCGHNIPDGFPFIGVEDEFIPKMKELGYEVAHNKCRPDADDSFVPKSVGGKTATKELAALPIFEVRQSAFGVYPDSVCFDLANENTLMAVFRTEEQANKFGRMMWGSMFYVEPMDSQHFA